MVDATGGLIGAAIGGVVALAGVLQSRAAQRDTAKQKTAAEELKQAKEEASRTQMVIDSWQGLTTSVRAELDAERRSRNEDVARERAVCDDVRTQLADALRREHRYQQVINDMTDSLVTLRRVVLSEVTETASQDGDTPIDVRPDGDDGDTLRI